MSRRRRRRIRTNHDSCFLYPFAADGTPWSSHIQWRSRSWRDGYGHTRRKKVRCCNGSTRRLFISGFGRWAVHRRGADARLLYSQAGSEYAYGRIRIEDAPHRRDSCRDRTCNTAGSSAYTWACYWGGNTVTKHQASTFELKAGGKPT